MQAVILAGGFGSRLMPVVNDRPKIMADISGRPFLELLINHLKKQNITDVILALGYLSEYIKSYFQTGIQLGVSIKYSIEDMPLGTAGAIKKAQDLLDNEFLLLNGDTYLDISYKKIEDFHHDKHADITLVLTGASKMQGRGAVTMGKKKKVISFREIDDDSKTKESYTNAGVYFINRKICKFIKSSEKVSLEKEVLPSVLDKLQIFGFISPSDFIDIGTPERYRHAKEILRSSI